MSKMFYYVGCVIVSILICNVSSKSVKTRDVDDEPKRCCLMNKFSGEGILTIIETIGNHTNTNETVDIMSRFAYDGERGLMGMKGLYKLSTDYETEFLWIIIDVQRRYTYLIDEKPEICSSGTGFFTPTCIPETATYVGSNITQFNNKEIITDTWKYTEVDDDNHVLTVYATVTRDDLCIPVFTQMFLFNIGFNQKSYLSGAYTHTISKIVPEIENKSIIEIPDKCLTDQ